jgi:aryl-alcohol dehydrogenase-like predicted oxidoreductase
MDTKKLGNSELNLTRIGLGTWAAGGGGWKFGWGPQDDEDTIKTIHTAMECGINWIDTAAVYGLGHAEEMVGKALKGMRHRPIIATKCERTWDTDGNIIPVLKKDSIKKECQNSLKRLQTEVIDLYQIHWPDPDNDIEEAWQAISELIEEGKVRYGGVSNFDVPQLRRIGSMHPVTSLQPPYSMIVPDIEEAILPYCARHHIGVICYSPMYKGLLTGKLTRARLQDLADDDHRRRDPRLLEPELSINLALVSKLTALAEREKCPLSDLALAWVLRRPEVTAAIVGARRPEQIIETSRIADWRLSESLMAEIDDLLAKRREQMSSL